MCGIIGILGQTDVASHLVEALRRLEYRGYDSAGIATLVDGQIDRRRAKGKLSNLDKVLKDAPLNGTSGIGHTRWATHGIPSAENAHPHATAKVAVVHNGIIENYKELKDKLIAKGHHFESETDTEVIAHLITLYIEEGLSAQEAFLKAVSEFEGAFSLAVIMTGEDNLMFGARQGTPLAVGYGDNEMFLASDSYALAPLTKKICFLEDGDRVIMSRENIQILDSSNNPVTREIRVTAQSGAAMGKGNYPHFMLKEIYEQPSVIGDTLNSFVNPATGEITLPEGVIESMRDATRLTLLACGGSYYACCLAKYWLEQIARIPCEVDIASEFRYREAPLPNGGVCIFVSQSGETLDTLEALRYCKKQDQKIISIVNTIESTIERESDFVLRTLAGQEIAVASTKATITQYTTLACLTLALARQNKTISAAQEKEMSLALRAVPTQAANILQHDEAIQKISKEIAEARDVLYLGRGSQYPIALEGALKLKEICYIHAEGYAAGEMKHGPIALIDDSVPIVVVANSQNEPLFEKTASNVQEAVARGGKVFLISDEDGAAKLKGHYKWSIIMGDIHPFVAPILYTIPVQLLAYHTAVTKGTDVDQPRNLAKSVTVE
ncbi:MAG: glutamine--fructose-6-phosphate transaminase (isomerizing) [Micavibrio sp.]|nr:glutamine--fructose-6-phosphate transaminase (isomerizing) [Micavibrio sp.]|tara:strand:- start:2444 stop:4276 length:1833 start_codon:yes stop_codon:yes gene_type:complete